MDRLSGQTIDHRDDGHRPGTAPIRASIRCLEKRLAWGRVKKAESFTPVWSGLIETGTTATGFGIGMPYYFSVRAVS